MTARSWSVEEVQALGVRTDVATAGSILGLSRTQAYIAVQEGRFPINVIHIGRRIVVPVPPILRLLGISTGDEHSPPDRDMAVAQETA